MIWWLTLTAAQLGYMFFPAKYWKYYLLQMRCWVRGCTCTNYYRETNLPPNVDRLLKDETLSLDFINSAWNLVEGKNLSKRQREAISVEKYFGGHRGSL